MSAIVTLSHNLPEWSQTTLGRLREYAERIGAEFLVLAPEQYNGFLDRGPLFEQALLTYGRCAFIDADCVVSREAPSIFDEHTPGNVWMVADSHPQDESQSNRFQDIVTTQAVMGAIRWIGGYGNMGVVVADSMHAEALRDWIDIPGTHHDQAQFNYHIRRLGYGIGFMDRKWNSMAIGKGLADKLFNCEAIAKDAYIAHAAGFAPHDRKYAIETFDALMP